MQLGERELKVAREAKAAAKGEKCEKTIQSWGGNRYKKEHNLKRGDVKGIDSWVYNSLGPPYFVSRVQGPDGVES